MKMRGIAFALWLAFLLAAEYVLLVPLNLTSVPFWGMVLVFGTLLLMIPAIPGRGSAKEREEGIPETEKVIGISRKRKAGHRDGSSMQAITRRRSERSKRQLLRRRGRRWIRSVISL